MDHHESFPPGVPAHASVATDIPGQWLSVNEAVPYCAQHGLHRNIKTIRRWAERSLKRPDEAEVKVREQDTGFGFRYMIDRDSLDLKIRQELEFEAKQKQPDTTGHDQPRPEMPGPARDAVEPSDDARTSADTPGSDRVDPDTSADARRLEVRTIGDDFLKEQVKAKDGQIAELSKQLERKDNQIMTMLERDRETNILIRGLQNTIGDILQLKAPNTNKGSGEIDHEPAGEPRITIYDQDTEIGAQDDGSDDVDPGAVDNPDPSDNTLGVQ